MFDVDKPDFKIGVVGAGLMGRGIAQVAAEADMSVILGDISSASLDAAVKFCRQMIERKIQTGKLGAEAGNRAIANLSSALAGGDHGFSAFADCDIVVEAVVERLDIKQSILAGLEASVSNRCIIATNTSSLSVTALASTALLPGRVAGFHFFNPVPLVRLVEVIRGEVTEPWVSDALAHVARRLGHTPVHAKDWPGFLVNHAGRAFVTEALRIISEGICDFADVDRVAVECAGFRMGPFELLDMMGLDTSHPVMESIYHQFYEEPRFRPSVIAARRVSAGKLGRKSGAGFYKYQDGKMIRPPEQPLPQVSGQMRPVWVSRRYADLCGPLLDELVGLGADLERTAAPSSGALILVTPLGQDATFAAMAEQLDPVRTVAVDCLFKSDSRRTVMGTPVTDPALLAQAVRQLGSRPGTKITTIADSAGFIAQRLIAMIVNTACEIAQQRIANPIDIDRAVEIGLAYPRGPLAFGDQLGPKRVLQILEAIHEHYADPRYRPSPWLRRRAALGVSLLLEEPRTRPHATD